MQPVNNNITVHEMNKLQAKPKDSADLYQPVSIVTIPIFHTARNVNTTGADLYQPVSSPIFHTARNVNTTDADLYQPVSSVIIPIFHTARNIRQ